MNVHIDDDTALSLRLVAIRLGLPAEDIARYAVADFIARHSGG